MVAIISEHQSGTIFIGIAQPQDAFQQLRDHRYADFLGTKKGAEIPGVPPGSLPFQLHFEF